MLEHALVLEVEHVSLIDDELGLAQTCVLMRHSHHVLKRHQTLVLCSNLHQHRVLRQQLITHDILLQFFLVLR